jgi:uncharacterized membrane protein
MRVQSAGAGRSGRTGAAHNVARPERVASVTLGTALLAYGLRRRDATGIAAAIIGGFFMHRGATGNCAIYDALGVGTGDAEAVLDSPRRKRIRAATINAEIPGDEVAAI